ncbi:hypothetical protein BDW66DRAFT_148879 [Aspergillus desertorum]
MSAEHTRHGVKGKLKDVKGKFKRLWQQDHRTLASRIADESQSAPSKLNAERHDAVLHDKPKQEQRGRSRRRDQFTDTSSIQAGSAPPTKPDLWQRAFDDLELEQQQLIKSIPMPVYNKTIEYNDANLNPETVSRLKALSGVVEAVKIQYEIDQEKSRIKEPAQKIVKAILSFQDFSRQLWHSTRQDTQLASGQSCPWD